MKRDVVLWGATGFTGTLVAEYLLRTVGVGGSVSWALAGRNEAKLGALRDRLAGQDPAAADLPVLTGDAADPASLRALAAQARVVCTTVGPYIRYGQDIVAAYVQEGAHYCDLTGEAQFMRLMIDRHHEAARANKVRIVHTCGFDSIPSDLGALRLQETAIERFGHPLPRVTMYVRRMGGAISGGTVASMAAMMEQADDPATRKVLGDPYSLLPEGAPRGPRVHDVRGVAWDADEQAWTGTFVMATTNAKVVRRTNALLDMRYGEDFAYEEVQSFRPGVRGMARAATWTAGLGAFTAAMGLGPTRRLLLARVLPSPGEGPDEATREAGSFEVHHVGHGPGSESLRVAVRGDKDPGYGCTAGMLGESALCLALDDDRLPDRYGVLTPASAMGEVLSARLPRAGVTIEVP